MSTNRRWYWAVIWHNPYTLPPDGYSRLMLVVEGERGQCPDEIEQLYTALRARPAMYIMRGMFIGGHVGLRFPVASTAGASSLSGLTTLSMSRIALSQC